PFEFDKTHEIGSIQKGDLFFACVSGDELNPPEGTECEHRETSHTRHIHNLVARWKRAFTTTWDGLGIQSIFLIYAMGNTFSQDLSRYESPYNEDLQELRDTTLGKITII
ncbi:MAG: hypothetical protein QOK78_01320, partial [Nitrososphaeraceae archaeon]|nr:hypothetical protein [Nitrososphaeraceae archaeon]